MLTAIANDLGYENGFSEQRKKWIRAKDLPLAISAGEKSPCVIHAIRHSQEQRAEVVGILRFNGGVAAQLADLPILDRCENGVVDDVHLIINHITVDCVAHRFAVVREWVA